MDAVLVRVLAIVTRIAGRQRTPTHAGPETPLAEGGFWLDSVGLLEVVVACEEELGIIFDPDADLTGEALSTVQTLAGMVRTKLPKGPSIPTS